MDTNIIGLIVSFAFLFLIVGLGFVLKRYTPASGEVVRKVIHIGVSHWVFILVHYFTKLSFALVGPIFFIIGNTAFVYLGMGKYLGMEDRKRNNGLIYFPISLLILTFFWARGSLSSAEIEFAVLAMGWGDGLAALVGSRWGRHPYQLFGMHKSLEGSAVMALVVLLLGFLLLSLPWYLVIALALLVTLAEAITPYGFDNISVPLLAAALVRCFA